MRIPPALAFAGCVAIWSGSWLAIRIGAASAPPFGTGALRALLAAAILGALAIAFRAPRPSRAGLARAALAGAVLIGANFILVYWSAPRLPTSVSALLYATVPLQAAILAPALDRTDRLSPRVVLGAIVGLAGIALAFGSAGALASVALLPAALIVLAATTSAGGSALSRRARDVHPLWLNAIANGTGAIPLVAASLLARESSPVPPTPIAWLAFAYMLLLGSVVGFLLYFSVIHAWGAARASYVTLLTPFGALALAAVIAREPVGVAMIGGALLLAAGGWLALRRRPSPSPSPSNPTRRGEGGEEGEGEGTSLATAPARRAI